MPASHPAEHVKISEDVNPTHYVLTIKTDLDKLTFEGRAEIDLDVNADTSSITFHAAEPITVTYAALSSSNLKTESLQTAKSIDVDEELERATVTFDEGVKKGTKAKLGVAWTGVLNSSMTGYYKSSFEYEGRKGFYGLTQFEPTAARRAFPSWDEPAIKATFDISLLSRSSTVSLSNMNALSSSPSTGAFLPSPLFVAAGQAGEKGPAEKGPSEKGPTGDWTLTKFATTPKMSTYLIAWANGEFKYVESSVTSPLTGQKTDLKVYTTPEYITQAGLTLDVTARILPIYEKIFDIPYPLPKLDTLVASDFDAGAMENWGLITGRTAFYLYEEGKSGIAAKKRTTEGQSHEVAHQWFGNIVTMKWWDNLWLNEAFATLMGEVIILERIHPEWRPNMDFIHDHLSRALHLDSLRSSHPIEVACPNEKAINQIFDAISYSKGASVLRMLSYMIGEETFLKGVSNYLKAHLYSNSVTADLWRGISEASGVNVNEIMANWTLKVGFPLITVEETEHGLHVAQHRFLATNDVKPEEDETLWYVPLNIKTIHAGAKVDIDTKTVLTTREADIKISAGNSLYKLNGDTTGVYRVKYPAHHLEKLGDEAAKSNSALSSSDRMGLVADAFVLAKTGHSATADALNLASKLQDEGDYLVWAEIAEGVADIRTVWWEEPDEVKGALKALTRSLFGPLVEKLGMDFAEGESPEVTQWRITAVNTAAAADDPKTVEEAVRRFRLLLEKNDDSQIPSDLYRIIYSTAIRKGGKAEYERVLEIYRKPQNPAQKAAAMLALCRSEDPSLIQRTFDFILSGEVKEQDYMYFFAGLSANFSSRRQTWDYLKENLDILTEKFKGNFSMGRLVQYSFQSLTTEEDVAAVERFFQGKDTSTYAQPLAQGLDDVRTSSAWLKRDRSAVESWLREHSFV